MRILILFIFCLSVIGCGRRGERIHNIQDLEQGQLNVVNNKFDIDIISLNLNTRNKRNMKPICRGIEGCLTVCEYFDKPKCKQLSVDKVLAFWLNQISMYDKWEHAKNDLNLIATEPDVSAFLSNVDKDNRVMKALFDLGDSAHCPINDQPNIKFSQTPYVSLFLVAPKETPAPQTEADAKAEADLQKAVEEATAEVKAAKEALAVAEAGMTTAQEALQAAEEAKVGLAADASQEDLKAADAKVATAKEALAAVKAKVAAAKEAVEAAEAKLVVAQKAADANMRVDCAPVEFFLDDGLDAAKAAALASQERAKKCPGLEYVEFSVDGATVKAEAAKEALAAAEAEVATAQEALQAAEEAKVGLAADTPQEAVDAAEAEVITAKEALAAAELKVATAQEAVEAAEAEAGDAEREVATEDDAATEMQKQMPVSTQKKIMDGQVLYFNLAVFAGYIKQCFGFESKTFSQLALEIENKKAFEMGDKVISEACSENSECIRLAYCAMDSELVRENLKPSIKETGCDYESFSEMLP